MQMHHGVSSTSPRRGEVDAPPGLAFGKPKGELRASGEGRSDYQLKLIEPLTPALSPPGRGSAGAVP
jgi:hypothetical protein